VKKAKVIPSELLKPGQKYLTRVELARVLNVSVRKVDSMIAAREIPVLHFGKMVRFRLEDVERRLNQAMLTESEDYNTPNTPTA
jgi:excisionase family DNA binding protein